MKFLCLDCDRQMTFSERQQPGDGTFAASFRCPGCGRAIALLANPMETQLVGSLGVEIGGRELDREPMALVRERVESRPDAFQPDQPPGRPQWTPEAEERLARAPKFVRGMIRRIYAEYAAERGIPRITPDVMDQARTELGLEGM